MAGDDDIVKRSISVLDQNISRGESTQSSSMIKNFILRHQQKKNNNNNMSYN